MTYYTSETVIGDLIGKLKNEMDRAASVPTPAKETPPAEPKDRNE